MNEFGFEMKRTYNYQTVMVSESITRSNETDEQWELEKTSLIERVKLKVELELQTLKQPDWLSKGSKEEHLRMFGKN